VTEGEGLRKRRGEKGRRGDGSLEVNEKTKQELPPEKRGKKLR